MTALVQALRHTDNRAALDAVRALIDRFVVHAPETDYDPPWIEVIGQLVELLKAAGVGRTEDKTDCTQDEAFSASSPVR